MGLLVTDLKHDYSTTLIQRADRLDLGAVEEAYRALKGQGRATLEREGVRPEDTAFLRQVDMRYVGQSYELTVPLSDGRLGPPEIARVLDHFHVEHDRAYGYSVPDEPAEFVNLRLTAIGKITKPRLRELGRDSGDAASARKAVRPVYFSEGGGYVDCPIYDRYGLRAGCLVEGPAVVEEIDSTTVIHPGYRAMVDRFGNLILSSNGVKAV
jgi:N-methylhydantoinase A